MPQKTIDIEKALCPDKNILKVDDDGNITSKILDAELDILDCEFLNDSCVTINTENLTYVTLTRENLVELLDLIDKSDVMYEGMEDQG